MADNSIEILVKAVDQVSSTMDKISKNITNSNKEMADANKKTAMTFENTAGTLLRFGNIASSVDNILSALTNQQLRLESATLRLINAQESLADAGKNLSRANRDVERAQKELAEAEQNRFKDFDEYERAILNLERAEERKTDAQVAEERAARNLIITENNLKRAQDQVMGTYISIGIQSLTLANSIFPTLVSAINAVGVSLQLARAAATGLVVGGFIYLIEKAIQAGDASNYAGIHKQLDGVIDKLHSVEIAASRVFDVMKKLLEQEAQLKDVQRRFGVNTGTIQSGGPKANIPERIVQGPGGPIVIGGGTSVGDAIIRPDGSIIHTDPRDTLIAAKDLDTSFGGMGGGGGVYIDLSNSNIYGTDPEQMAKEIWKMVRRKISI